MRPGHSAASVRREIVWGVAIARSAIGPAVERLTRETPIARETRLFELNVTDEQQTVPGRRGSFPGQVGQIGQVQPVTEQAEQPREITHDF